MASYFIVKIDISSKQKYIFSSNKLKEIIGASEIIKFVTEELAEKVLSSMSRNKKLFIDQEGKLNIDGNVLFEAGGNSMYIFKTEKNAQEFNKIFSRFAMKYFDGLELVMVICEFNMQEEYIDEIYNKIEDKLTIKKGIRKNEFRRIGYGLTRLCKSSRKPAEYIREEDGSIVSKESNDKLDFFDIKHNKNDKKYFIGKYEVKIPKEDFKERISKCLSKEVKEKFKNFSFTDELDIISGKLNEGSYIGVTCIDGNGMGKKIGNFNKSFRENFNKKYESRNEIKQNREKFNIEYIKEFNKLTEEIKKKYNKAFVNTIQELVKNYDNYREKINFDKDDKIIPLRPIIMAGDDITFISNGKIAIDTTMIFTENITNERVEFGDEKYHLTISAGVAIVKKNHPFFRAVKLASELEKSSKNRLQKIKKGFKKLKDITNDEYDASLIDWHIDRGNSSSELFDIRKKSYEYWEREVTDKNKLLVARPYIVSIGMESDLLNITVHSDEIEELKTIVDFKIDNFLRVLSGINNSKAKSNLKEFFRIMNLNELDSRLFRLKYGLQNKIKGDFNVKLLEPLVYDAIDSMDLYVCVKGENND